MIQNFFLQNLHLNGFLCRAKFREQNFYFTTSNFLLLSTNTHYAGTNERRLPHGTIADYRRIGAEANHICFLVRPIFRKPLYGKTAQNAANAPEQQP